MPLTPKEMIKYLQKHGFTVVSQKGSHVKLKNSESGKSVIVPQHNNRHMEVVK